MNSDRLGETLLGAIVALVAIGFLSFAVANAGQSTGASGGYALTARFQNVDGVAVGTDVRVSGVKVGVVRDIKLDPESYLAQVTMNIAPTVHVADQSVARIASEGILGGNYISIEPAGLDPLPAGGEIVNTQGAVDLLTLLSGLAQTASSSSSSQEHTSP